FIYSILGIVFIEINLKYPLLSNDSIPTKYGIIKAQFDEICQVKENAFTQYKLAGREPFAYRGRRIP
ncbi:hypothetical protein NNU22_005216, partial [Raoultella ornithinolytica]